jgi:3,4-dihydroxy-2-butanone 4-phosphate synthase
MKRRYKQMKRGTAPIPFVLEALSKGQIVVVADDDNRETEAAVELTRLADLTPAGVLVEILRRDGSAARRPDLYYWRLSTPYFSLEQKCGVM